MRLGILCFMDVITWVFICFIFTKSVFGYELATHARITNQSYNNSILSLDETKLDELGVSELDISNPFGAFYYDVTGSSVNVRDAENFSKQKDRMPNPDVESLTIKGWLMRGAIREDDLGRCRGFRLSDDQPYDDPDGDITRVLQHFYDPINDEGLNGAALQAFIKEKLPCLDA